MVWLYKIAHWLPARVQFFGLMALVGAFSSGAHGQVIYTGTWTNTTFSSTGAATFTFSGDDLIIDLDGNVFGASNPPARTLTDRSISATGVTYTKSNDGTYGNMSITANFDGTFSYTFSNVPGLSGGTVTGTGSIDQSSVDLNYDVGFAVGIIETSLSSGDPTQVGDPFFFSQFGNGSGAGLTFTSDIVLPNPSATDTVSGLVAFGDAAGNALSVDVEGSSPATEVSFTIPPLGSTTISTTGLGDLATGSAVVVADGPLGGVVRFFISDFPGVGSGIAGVPASRPVNGFITPVRRVAGGVNTGIAVRNVGGDTVNLTLSLRQNGSQVASSSRSVAGNGQFAEFIDTLFPGADTSNFSGSAVITSDGMIAGTAIEQGVAPGQFTTLPVTPLE